MTANSAWDAVAAAVPANSRARIRALAESAGGVSFVEFARNALGQDVGPRKGSPSTVLLDSGALVRVISDPAMSSPEEAVELARAAARIDPRIDAKLLAAFAAVSLDWTQSAVGPWAARILDVLDAISDGSRLVMPLTRFTKMPDSRIRSKAVKLIARASRNGAWLGSVLRDPDPRIRGNVIEGLVTQIGREAEPLLRTAAQDPHHRVSTTALLGLAQFGDEWSRQELHRLAEDSREMHRRAAQWALGRLASTAEPGPVEEPGKVSPPIR